MHWFKFDLSKSNLLPEAQYRNGIKTEWRKYLRCDALIMATNGATTGLYKHEKPVHTAKTVILFLRSKMRNMSQAVRDVFQKWIDGNEVVEAIIQKCESIYDMVKEQLVYEEEFENDQACNLDADVSFHDFSKRLLDENFYTENYLTRFCPVSVHPERLLSLCRLSCNYFQCRMTVENHSCNVFISKDKSFMPE